MIKCASEIERTRDDFAALHLPAIRDFIIWNYEKLLPDERLAAAALAINHHGLVRCLFQKQTDAARPILAALLETATRHGIERTTLEDINSALIKELLNIISFRFRGNPDVASEALLIVTRFAHELWTVMKNKTA